MKRITISFIQEGKSGYPILLAYNMKKIDYIISHTVDHLNHIINPASC